LGVIGTRRADLPTPPGFENAAPEPWRPRLAGGVVSASPAKARRSSRAASAKEDHRLACTLPGLKERRLWGTRSV
jgi:hypothetical protein